MNAAHRLALTTATLNAARVASRSSHDYDEPDDDRYVATSLVDDLWSNRKGTIGLLILSGLLVVATAAFCLKDVTRAQIRIAMFAAWIVNALAVSFYRLYLSGTLKYLCRYRPDRELESLSGAEILHRYKRACGCGVLAVLLNLGTIALLAWMETRLYTPDLLRLPIIPMVLLAAVSLISLVQAIRVLISAHNVRRTSKWWAEERADGSTLSFAEYAHTPIE